MSNLHPTTNTISREEKELRMGQRAKVIWMTGLSGSGKSTLATALERSLFNQGYSVALLDGDNIRAGINSNLSFSSEDRKENIRRIAEIAKLFIANGQICIVSFISPTVEMREMAKKIIGEDQFIEVFVDTPLKICEERDVKGLYKKARTGEIPEFTGVSASYEIPEKPDIHLKTDNKSVADSIAELFEYVLIRIRW